MNNASATLVASRRTAPPPRRSAEQAHWNEGLTLSGRGDWPGAARAFRRATRVAPLDALYWLNLARAERHAGRLDHAVSAVRRCLALDPAQTLARRLLGECLMLQHHHAEAVQVFAALEAAGECEPEAMTQHASALMQLLRFKDAADLLLRTLALRPQMASAHAMLACALRDQGHKREAVECFKTAVLLEPRNLELHIRLAFERRHVCDWSDFDIELQGIADLLSALAPGAAHPTAPFSTLSLPLAPELQLAAARAEALQQSAGAQLLPPLLPSPRPQDARVCLGLVSYDFREHPVSQLLVDVLEGLDRSRFSLRLYSLGPEDDSALRRRVLAAADAFVDLRSMGDEQAAERIRADGVELLVDLMGHTRGQRMGVLARRPAPVQLAFLGYPGSTGASFIDYLIGDPLVTPLELAPLYSEKLAQLPQCFLPNGRWRPLPQPLARAAAGLPEDAFVMCAFNHTYKILPEAFDAWCAVLREVPHAVLWLKQTNEQLHDNVAREARRRGVDPARIHYAPKVPYAEYFSRLALADVFVDTWPYNAHTTAADALWAGVPVVTLYGNGFASRVAASALSAVGLGELAFDTVDDYRHAILALALEPALRQNYRAHLTTQRMTLPLFDSPRYTREFETLLLRMSARWRAGLPAAHLPATEI